MFRILLLLVWVASLGFGYEEAASGGYYAPQSTYHPLYEQRRNRLLGVYGSYSKSDSDADLHITGYESQVHSLSEKQFGFGVQVGYLLSENHRILASFEHYLKKNGFSYQVLTLGYALTPKIPNTTNWRALFGINAGLTQAKFDSGSFKIGEDSMDSLDYMGFTYGVKAGAIYALQNGELEFGIQARRLNFGEEESQVNIQGNETPTKLNLSQTSSINLYMGYNFLF
ncbi:hypothetical protein [uncultured Helicobacter sp.]|uniref:hypothetical protein n=1 Tax=uncultured Helicobacter sp. TaxID=175537 RepID=UPI002625A67D|nr:hypothetical protein [uncultured Helicobacter sp.]